MWLLHIDCDYKALSAVITAPEEYQLFGSDQYTLRALGPTREPALTPRQVHQILQDNWKKVRAALQAKGIKTKGLTTTEPNQVGLPHFNLLLFFKTQKQMDSAVLILQKHFGGDRSSD